MSKGFISGFVFALAVVVLALSVAGIFILVAG